MKKTELIKILSYAVVNYPNFQLDDLRIDLFYNMLKDLDKDLLQIAMLKHISISNFPPTIADLRKLCVEIGSKDMNKDSASAWGEVTLGIRRYGVYEPEKAYKLMSPLTQKIVKQIGWSNICGSTNPGVERGQFIKMYDTYKNRIKSEQQIPSFISEKILQLQNQNSYTNQIENNIGNFLLK